MGRGSYVEVRHVGVRDDPGVDQALEQSLVLLVRLHLRGSTGGGPALPDHRPHAGIAGVLALEEGRAGRQRQQDGQGVLDPRDQSHGEVGVVHAHVHLESADEVLIDQQPVVLLHPPVPPERGELEIGGTGQGSGSGCGDGQPLSLGGVDDPFPEPEQLETHVVERRHDLGIGLDGAPLQLGRVALGGELAEQLRRPEGQFQGLGIDDLELLFDA